MDQNLADCQTQTAERVLVKRGKTTIAETEICVAQPGEERVLMRRVFTGLPLSQFGTLVPEHLVDHLKIFFFFLDHLILVSVGIAEMAGQAESVQIHFGFLGLDRFKIEKYSAYQSKIVTFYETDKSHHLKRLEKLFKE